MRHGHVRRLVSRVISSFFKIRTGRNQIEQQNTRNGDSKSPANETSGSVVTKKTKQGAGNMHKFSHR